MPSGKISLAERINQATEVRYCVCRGECGKLHGSLLFDPNDTHCGNTGIVYKKSSLCQSCWARKNKEMLTEARAEAYKKKAVAKAKVAFKALDDRTYTMPGFEREEPEKI